MAEMRELLVPDGDLDLALQEERNRTKWVGCLGSMVIESANRRNAVLGFHNSAEGECLPECYATSTGAAIDVSEQRAARSSWTDSPLIEKRHASGNRA